MATKVTVDHAEMRDARPGRGGQISLLSGLGATNTTATKESLNSNHLQLFDAVFERENMFRALHRVESNKGAAGVDGIDSSGLRDLLKEHWPSIKEDLLAGTYRPQPVLGVQIPKPGGGVRQLGIPTVVDRLIQQALHQALCPVFDSNFSESSFGFRPGRSAHQAVRQAQAHVASGRRFVVDIDLDKFFDRVNHDILMSRIARRIKDKRVLRLIRLYLQAGMTVNGKTMARREGTPQGGPLSPLLSNILLDDLDKELERRGHLFCRYADDCVIFVRSKRAGERVLVSLTQFLEKKLKLKVNTTKSRVDRPWKRKFLGYSMTNHFEPRLKVAPESVQRLKANLKHLFRQGRGCNLGRLIREDLMPKLRGWMYYFGLAETKGVFEELDQWLRRKLRCIIWRQWKRPATRRKRLITRGLRESHASQSAYNGRGAWRNAGAAHMNLAFPKKYFDALGLVALQQQLREIQCL